ncbi:MAG: carbon storage regulator [Planctomycetaceae bacterium]
MLVLTRKTNEEIVIDGIIRVRVLSAEGGRIRLGIVAPRSVPVHRAEVADACQWNASADAIVPVATLSVA